MKKEVAEETEENFITAEERAMLRHELAERIKDLVFFRAEHSASEALEHIGNFLGLHSDFAVEAIFKIQFSAGELQQILARSRRK